MHLLLQLQQPAQGLLLPAGELQLQLGLLRRRLCRCCCRWLLLV
jgi:hypothetical protein